MITLFSKLQALSTSLTLLPRRLHLPVIAYRRIAVIPFMRLLLLFVAYGLYPVSIAQGGTINVSANQSIQTAISAATNGDIIVVAPGTYRETIDFLGKEITLKSSGGPLKTTIDGSGVNGSVVQCVNGEGPNTVIEGFTITGGHAEIGGGMLNISSSPTIIDCIFKDNLADDRGGGMYNREGNPVVMNSTFDGNTAIAMGGGMFNLRASPTVTGCLFTHNIANKGAGMRNYLNSHARVTSSIFSYNDAGEEGGGMDNRKNSNAVVTGCIFEGNTAGSGGGGMHNYVGRAEATGNPSITNTLFIRNSAPSGAGMRNNDPNPDITNTTIAHNIGSGISSRNGSAPVIKNSIIWGNSDESFSGASSGLSVVSHSDIEGGFPGTGNLNTNPLFLNPAGNDYRLIVGSFLIDAGNNDPTLPATDLAGNPRIIGGTVDMGAYEFDASCSVGEGVDGDNDGYTTCGGDCNDSDLNINPSSTEICDFIDNNCSGTIDEGFDSDNDGYTICGGDCNDTDDSVNPSAAEICDGIDNNCNGIIDEGFDNGCGVEPLLAKGASCTQDSECVSNKCKGGPGKMTCK